MDIHATFISFKSDPDVVELVHAWDEDALDNNPEGYQDSLTKSLASYEGDVGAQVTVRIAVNRHEIVAALNSSPRIEGTVTPPAGEHSMTRAES